MRDNLSTFARSSDLVEGVRRPIEHRQVLSTREPPSAEDHRDQLWSDFYAEALLLTAARDGLLVSGNCGFLEIHGGSHGFRIQAGVEQRGFWLSMGTWFDDFESASMVLSLINKAISGQARVRTEKRGSKILVSSLEIFVQGQWIEKSQMGYPSWSLFRKDTDVSYQYFDRAVDALA